MSQTGSSSKHAHIQWFRASDVDDLNSNHVTGQKMISPNNPGYSLEMRKELGNFKGELRLYPKSFDNEVDRQNVHKGVSVSLILKAGKTTPEADNLANGYKPSPASSRGNTSCELGTNSEDDVVVFCGRMQGKASSDSGIESDEEDEDEHDVFVFRGRSQSNTNNDSGFESGEDCEIEAVVFRSRLTRDTMPIKIKNMANAIDF
ncbi:hypothetical protein BDV96DRAFT_599107 [Lophiotrema nucula]|uniref:Uncharacterized protein n=1 Tax=Lophiotrema nucula TaxID=690887 RepID=A0A6A5ZA88_9PLEO|nr:hypothetical protein BDV96DRAFT_599107 [Lophiotrema nucula]